MTNTARDKSKIFIALKNLIRDKRGGACLFILICLEILFVGIVLFKDVFRSNITQDYSISNFVSDSYSNVSFDGSDLVFTTSEDVSPDQIQSLASNSFSLPHGAYDFIITYESDTGSGKDASKGTAYFTVASNTLEIESDEVLLDDGHNQITGRFWISSFSKSNGINFIIKYYGLGSLKISGCQIVESRAYRNISFLFMLVIITIIDFLFICFFTDYELKIKKYILPVAGIVAIASLPFFSNFVFGGSDLWFHMMRIASIGQELSNGQFPVRIATELNNGYGYPTSLYYCDIFLYLPALLYIWHFPLRFCYQFYVVCVNLFTAIFTYYAMTKFTKDRNLMLLGTAIYMLGTYRLVNLSVRAAAGEYTAMCFLPLIVVGIYNILKNDDIKLVHWFPLAAGMAGVIMCHTVTVEMLGINLLILVLVFIVKLIDKNKILAVIKSIITCLLMTVWFIVPFIDSVKSQSTLVQKEDLRMLGNTTESLISLFDIFAPGHDLSNWICIGLTFDLGIILLLYCLYKWKNGANSTDEAKFNKKVFYTVSGFAFLNIFFVTNLFPWNKIQYKLGIDKYGQLLGTIQYAWRFLAIASVLLSFAIVIGLDYLNQANSLVYKSSFIILIVAIVIGTGSFYHGLYDYGNQEEWTNVQSFTGSDHLYLLEGTDINIRDISACQVVSGNAELGQYSKENDIASLDITASADANTLVSFPIFAYKHYHVYGTSGSTTTELQYSIDENNCILVTVPAGFSGTITVVFEEPVIWKICNVVSFITWASVAGYAIYTMVSKSKSKEIINGQIDKEDLSA